MTVTGQPAKKRNCTAFRDSGQPCGNYAPCTKVTVKAARNRFTRYVCPDCRKRMDLPDHDVVLTPKPAFPIVGR